MSGTMATMAKLVRRMTPLELRIRIAASLSRNRWIPYIGRWSDALVRDLEAIDPKRYHKFLWEKHLDSYGRRYEPAELFSAHKLNGTTEAYSAFIRDLGAALERLGIDGTVGGVLDVGCSAGHVLRALETEVMPETEVLVGIDIDRYATASGSAYLSEVGSKIRLLCGDLEELDQLLDKQTFDFSFAAGSLSYLNQADTQNAVWTILSRTDKLAAFIGLAYPDGPNDELPASVFREQLGSMWTHNFGDMVEARGWEVLSTRWKPPSGSDRQGLYSVFASPPLRPFRGSSDRASTFKIA